MDTRPLTLSTKWIAAFFAFVIASSSPAQRAEELLPSPLGSRVLTKQLERYVAPSVAQWVSIEPLHAAYLDRFELLREEKIAPFLEFVIVQMGRTPDVATTEKYLRELELVRRHIASEDDRLFNEISERLNDNQQPGLKRVRETRERKRIAAGLRAGRGETTILELWPFVERFAQGLTPEAMDNLDHEMAAYEARMLPALRKWRAAQMEMLRIFVDRASAVDFNALKGNDVSEEERAQAIALLQIAMVEAEYGNTPAAQAILDVNTRAIDGIERIAGDPAGRRIRMAFQAQANPGIIDEDPEKLERIFERLLGELQDESRREEVAAIRSAYRARDDQLVKPLITTAAVFRDHRTAHYRAATVAVGEPTAELVALIEKEKQSQEKIEELQAKRTALAQEQRATLRSIFESPLDAAALAIIESGGKTVARSGASQHDNIEESRRLTAGGGATGFLPKPFTRRSLASLARQIGSQPWEDAILATIHDDYLVAWRQSITPACASCERAQSAIYSINSETMKQHANVEQLRNAYGWARAALQASAELDEKLFADIAAVGEPQQGVFVARARLQRKLETALRGTDPVFKPNRKQATAPNPLTVLFEFGVDDSEVESLAVEKVLLEGGAALCESAQAARDVRMQSEQHLYEMNIRLTEGMIDGSVTSTDYGIAYRKLSETMAREFGAVVRAWDVQLEGFVSALAAALGSSRGASFERAWRISKHQSVYRDPRSATNPIQQALELHDLGEDQLKVIAEILDEHDREWTTLSDEMALVAEEQAGFGALTPPSQYDRFNILNTRYESLQQQREEVNLRALRRLSRYLTPEQRKRVRALALLEESDLHE